MDLVAGVDRVSWRVCSGIKRHLRQFLGQFMTEQEPTPDEPTPVKELPGALAFVGMGTTIAGSVGLGVGLGLWADSHWGSAPWGLVIGVVIGSVLAVAAVAGQVRRYL